MRRSSILLIGFALFAACDPINDDPYGDGTANEIVFGIEQSAEGVAADYDFIGLEGHGGSVSVAFREGDGEGECWFEDLDDRLGKPHVENGTARWSGGTLPTDGLLVLGNQTQPTKQDGPGWTSSDYLTFTAEGFAMPPLDRVSMRAPVVDLTIDSIAPAPDAAGAIAITPATDVAVTWTPPAFETASRVLVTLETEHANVRCFDEMSTGTATVPAKWIARLFPADAVADAGAPTPIAGKLTIASHRQTTILARGGWIVYVVATSVHRDIAFTGTR